MDSPTVTTIAAATCASRFHTFCSSGSSSNSECSLAIHQAASSPHCEHIFAIDASSGLAYPLIQLPTVLAPALPSAFAAALSVGMERASIHLSIRILDDAM